MDSSCNCFPIAARMKSDLFMANPKSTARSMPSSMDGDMTILSCFFFILPPYIVYIINVIYRYSYTVYMRYKECLKKK